MGGRGQGLRLPPVRGPTTAAERRALLRRRDRSTGRVAVEDDSVAPDNEPTVEDCGIGRSSRGQSRECLDAGRRPESSTIRYAFLTRDPNAPEHLAPPPGGELLGVTGIPG